MCDSSKFLVVVALLLPTSSLIGDDVLELIKNLKDKDPSVRKSAAETLGEIDDKRAILPLINALKDEDWNVRSDAAEALGDISDEKAVPALEVIWKKKDESRWVKIWVVYALFKIVNREDAFEFLLDILKGGDTLNLWIALRALQKITGEGFGEDYRRWLDWLKKQKK